MALIIIIIIIGAGIAQRVQRPTYCLDDQGFQCRQEQDTSLFSKTSIHSLGPTQPPIRSVLRFFFLQWSGRNVNLTNHLTLNAGVKHEWFYTFIPPVWFHSVVRDSLTFTAMFYFYCHCSQDPVVLHGNSNSWMLLPPYCFFLRQLLCRCWLFPCSSEGEEIDFRCLLRWIPELVFWGVTPWLPTFLRNLLPQSPS